ncbi:hypothetical protein E6P97_03000 [Patescibacteria group bacterium]|nr:MAG: hypothetical protein E6P97_03000 [Patescibacteria group bacterium]
MTQPSENSHPTNPFMGMVTPENPGTLRRAVAIGVGAGVTCIALKYGIDGSGILDTAITPDMPVVPEIVEGFVAGNDLLRTVAPAVATGAVATHMYKRSEAVSSVGDAVAQQLAKGDYSGTDRLDAAPKCSRLSKMKRALGGVGVAALAVLITGGSSGVEREVSNGPLRAVDGMFDALAGDATHRSILLQGDNTRLTFMDDSYIPRSDMQEFIEHVSGETDGDVVVYPVNKALPNIDGQSAIILSVPDDLFTAATGETVAEQCDDMTLILDDAHSAGRGDVVDVNGVPATVVGKTSGLAQMNRHVGVMPESQFDTCVRRTTDGSYFGAVIASDNPEALSELKATAPNSSIIPESEFRELNLKFWQKNVTPVLFQLIAWSGVFAVAAVSGERRSAMLRNMKEIGTLHAQGVSMKAIGAIERTRALGETIKATALAAPLLPAFAAVFNAAEMGLKVGVGLRELSVGFAVTLAAKVGGSMRATRRFGRELPAKLAETVKG